MTPEPTGFLKSKSLAARRVRTPHSAFRTPHSFCYYPVDDRSGTWLSGDAAWRPYTSPQGGTAAGRRGDFRGQARRRIPDVESFYRWRTAARTARPGPAGG